MTVSTLFRDYAAAARPQIDTALDALLPPAGSSPARLHEAMRYAVFAGGKRFRPTLVLAAGDLFGAPRAGLLAGTSAIELIHTYSLVHDDLPSLDDDDLRRGRPTVHRAFDEATAVLVGDALLTLGLTTLSRTPDTLAGAERARAVAVVGEAIGSGGMIGGQAEDLAAEASWPEDPGAALERIHRGKTAALVAASLRLGGIYAGVDEMTEAALTALGDEIGLLFQIGDDLLDIEGTTSELGKTAGKDARRHKLTYPELYGVESSRQRLAVAAGRAAERVAALPVDAKLLTSLIGFLSERTS